MLYNSLSNRLLTIHPEFERDVQKIKSDPMGYDFSGSLAVLTSLLQSKVLVGRQEEEDFLESRCMLHNKACDDISRLALTVLVTEDCNFGCPYCYEKNKRSVDMTPETVIRLKDFITASCPLERLDVTWFGGEPLLRFDLMLEMSRWLVDAGILFSASIVTNGWGLTEEVTRYLEEMRVSKIQVTLDGPPPVHNARRFHLERGDSHHVIQGNLDRLMLDENWQGGLSINCVVDEDNAYVFDETRAYWSNRYPASDVKIRATFRDKTERGLALSGCLSREQEVDFCLQQYRKNGGSGIALLPQKNSLACLASCRNAFVVGAEGQLYKCLDDVGKKEMEVGSIFISPEEWDSQVADRYRVAGNSYEFSKCRSCFYLPICTPCPNMRYRAEYAKQKISPCPPFKHRFPEFLEMHHAKALECSSPSGACGHDRCFDIHTALRS